MDWTYKHFNQQAVFSAPTSSVLEVARAVVSTSLGQIEDTADGFVARGRTAGYAAIATVHAASAVNGTQLDLELKVERAGYRGFMLFDIGGTFNAQIDRWFRAISERLASLGEQALVSKTTSSVWVQKGCLAGCVVWLLVVACLGTLATALDRGLYPGLSESTPGPFTIAASTIAFLAGLAAFIYVVFPDSSISKFLRERLTRRRDNGRGQ